MRRGTATYAPHGHVRIVHCHVRAALPRARCTATCALHGHECTTCALHGQVHALAYPIGSHFHVAHGLSNSLMLPHVLAFNAAVPAAAEHYASLAPLIFPPSPSASPTLGVPRAAERNLEAALALAESFRQLAVELGIPPHTLMRARSCVRAHARAFAHAHTAGCMLTRRARVTHARAHPRQTGIPTRLTAVGIAAADVDLLASESMKQTRLLPNNPREVTLEDARRLYTQAL
jgi:alcohol dehydrogenase class IV